MFGVGAGGHRTFDLGIFHGPMIGAGD